MIEEILDKFKGNKAIWLSVLFCLFIVLLGLIFYGLSRQPQTGSGEFPAYQTSFSSSEQAQPSLSDKDSKKQSSKAEITVDIKGAVQKEGVYTLPAGSRVSDAVKLAGGLTAEADRNSVNLAQKIEDEAVIYVAVKGENISVIAPVQPSADLGDSSAGDDSNEKINLNTATLAELQTISGIGEKRAQDIIDYRDSKGGFSSVEELAEISGIGEKTLAKLKEEVTVD
ncbi:helix-hairpin-helix domain-containing protein [Streptococcus sp. H31]|uniref:helix-hairpin-helix domain-containing protein n=1 Tax=Streptococcus huangxiaojuni TaxID=3237239 RepID=UPI0034A5B074